MSEPTTIKTRLEKLEGDTATFRTLTDQEISVPISILPEFEEGASAYFRILTEEEFNEENHQTFREVLNILLKTEN